MDHRLAELGQVLEALAKVMAAKIECTISLNTEADRYEVAVSGFYKHGSVRVYVENNEVVVQGRYGSLGVLYDPDTIISLNSIEWASWEDRGYMPTSAWVGLLEQEGYLRKIVETKTRIERV